MGRFKAECCVWFTVEFEDDGVSEIADQAHEAALDFIDIPMGRMDDLEVFLVTQAAPQPHTNEKEAE